MSFTEAKCSPRIGQAPQNARRGGQDGRERFPVGPARVGLSDGGSYEPVME